MAIYPPFLGHYWKVLLSYLGINKKKIYMEHREVIKLETLVRRRRPLQRELIKIFPEIAKMHKYIKYTHGIRTMKVTFDVFLEISADGQINNVDYMKVISMRTVNQRK